MVEFFVMLLVAFVLVFGFVRPVVAAPFFVGSGSMEPTLHGCSGCVNDRVLINKLFYDTTDPERGDIVLFDDPAGGDEPLTKRAVGLPGDTLALQDGALLVNGEPQDEPYLSPDARTTPDFGPTRVPEGHFFMMGDNRNSSVDSRSYGPVPEEAVIGSALVRFWPPGRIGGL